MRALLSLRKCLLRPLKGTALVTNWRRSVVDWTEASSLILVAKRGDNSGDSDGYDYRVLMAKRGVKSSFLANVYIFPGGQIDCDDFSHQWMLTFKEFADNNSVQIPGLRPPLITNSITRQQLLDNNNEVKLLNTDYALRISALRETFEETGIFLSKSNTTQLTKEIQSYGNRLRKSQIKFSDMCAELSLCPDVWSIYEWANWLTPAIEDKRFDTIFYMAFTDKEHETIIDDYELCDFVWGTPRELLAKYYSTEGMALPPPQIYELLRLQNIKDYASLRQIAINRQHLGLQRWLPKLFALNDVPLDTNQKIKLKLFGGNFMALLPGDCEYDNDNNYDNIIKTFYSIDKSKHRIHRCSLIDKKLYFECNFPLSCGQLTPIPFK